MGIAEAIAGLLVLLGTPVLTWLGVRHTNRATVTSAVASADANVAAAIKAADAQVAAALNAADAQVAAAVQAAEAQVAAAIEAANASRDTAVLAAQTQAQSEFLEHFHWACELVASDEARRRLVGIGVLESLLEDPDIHPTHLAAAAGVLRSATAPAIDRLGHDAAGNVAELPPVGEGGGP